MNTDHIIEKNRKVFSTFPDTPYLGEIRPRKKRMKALTLMTRAAAVLFIPLAIYTVIDLMSSFNFSWAFLSFLNSVHFSAFKST